MLVVFLLSHREMVFTSASSLLTANVSHGILGLALCLVGIHSAAVYLLALTKFSYSSFRVCFSDISWSTSNFLLSVNVYLSLMPQLLRRDQLWRYPLGPPKHELLRTISLLGQWSTSGPDWGIAHFFIATRNTIKGVGGKRTNEQNTWVNSRCKRGSYVTLCISCVHM